MKYEKTVTFSGEPSAALEIVKTTFLPNGFQITESTENSTRLKSNNYSWIQKQNNPLTGVSEIDISIDNSSISLKAELGTINKVIIFLITFLVGLAILMAIVFAIVFRKDENLKTIMILSIAPFAPWPILAPLMYYFLKARTCKALDILLANMGGQ